MPEPRITTPSRGSHRSASRNDVYAGDVMVVGGGISGIQASLDLANSGFKVFLVDKAPAIGGHMAQLDKVFPTNDCSMCIESPKLIECNRHPNIEILTCAEVETVAGEAGDFEAFLTRKPRYVIEDRCRGCGACSQYCPVNVPDPFNENLSDTKAVRLHFPQAAPLAAYIDPETCLFLREDKCAICAGVCKHKAIDLHQRERRLQMRVGAVILAPGYATFDPSEGRTYGYGRLPNVVTSLEFERILNADGPYRGELLRPSDNKPPKSIAWIQCVGSRGLAGGVDYCSAVCCMYALKQMILAKEHDADIEATVFHNDIRACGKEFEQFYERAKSLSGTRFIRSYVSIGRETPGSDCVPLRYSLGGTVNEEEFDMVVLSVGLKPPESARDLSERLGIALGPEDFCKTDDKDPLHTSRPGIFASGAFLGPMDIPEAVMTGSAAAALCGRLLSDRRGRLTRNKEYPEERDISAEEPRVGVFVCHCGANIGSVIDVASIVEYSSSLDNVAHAEELLFACSADATAQIAEKIREKDLNRVVVAACTPRTHEPLFQETLREAGINKYCFVMANIREHSSWVHSREKAKATQKAKDKVRMSVTRAVNLSPLEEIELPVTNKALVVGGGLSGMTTALSLADSGFDVYLVERGSELGSATRRDFRILEGMDIQKHLETLRRRAHENQRVHVLTDSRVAESFGYVGNFTTCVESNGAVREIKHGAAIIAIGAARHTPEEYLYGKHERVVTLSELDGLIAGGDERILYAESMAVILCVGSREEDRPHCSRICCSQAMRSVLRLKELNSNMEIYVLYRDMRTYGFNEELYREAANRGVKFIRYDAEDKPTVEAVNVDGNETLRVTVSEPVLEKKLVLDVDMISLATAVVPSPDAEEISRLFKAPLSRDGFFLEAHMKLRPVDFATEGVFVCGSAHFPKSTRETIAQAYAAAGRAATILAKETIVSSGAICSVDEALCTGCGLCHKVCQFAAIELVETPEGKKFIVTPAACQGCGACNAVCPTGAVSQHHFTDAQILAEIDSARPAPVRPGAFAPRILAFLCNWCGYAGADMAGVSRIQYAPAAREVRVMCSSRVHPKFIAEAFLKGIDGVLVCGCHLGDCHYIRANERTEAMMKFAKKRLKQLGIDPERLRHEHISASEGARYAEKIDDFTNVLTALGPLELTERQKEGLIELDPMFADKQTV